MPAASSAAPRSLSLPWTRSTVRQARSRAAAGSPGRGISLMELLLVLALLVIAGSLAVPSIAGAFGGAKLKRAGDHVIARWAEARARAIETGVPYQFRFTPNGSAYRVEALTEVLQPAAGARGPSPARSASEPAPAVRAETDASRPSLDKAPIVESQLPETIRFAGGQTARFEATTAERRVDDLQAMSSSWSAPIIFYPDGSASTASVVLQNEMPQYLRLTIRGLTGVARASGLLTRDQYEAGVRTQ